MVNYSRRRLLKYGAMSLLAIPVTGCSTGRKPTPPQEEHKDLLFKISLAQWSLHRTLFGARTSAERLRGLPMERVAATLRNDPSFLLRGKLDPLDFPVHARNHFGISAVEYVNTFYLGRARDERYLAELKRRADGEGVQNVLIMCDLEGDLGNPDPAERQRAIENHQQWIDAAAFLGCHAIRVNAKSEGSWLEQQKLAADGLHRLAQYGETRGIHVLVENHGGLSSNPNWLSATIEAADHPLVGTLPDFGNFRISDAEQYDYYQGVEQLMPYARAVSAKSIDFNPQGEHVPFDYLRLMRTVVNAGYRGFVGIEYEGEHLSEEAGIRATKKLLEKIHAQLLRELVDRQQDNLG